MKISIFGLGYVGVVCAGCLARDGHSVIGVDTNRSKVDLINKGQTTIIENELDVLIRDGASQGRLRAIMSAAEAVNESDISLVCVGTPSQLNGNLDLSYVRRVCEEIGEGLAQKHGFHVVVIRSTMLPGSMRNLVIPTLEEYSGKSASEDFGICINPEFLREGTAVNDFYHPPKIVIGENDGKSGEILAEIYGALEAPLIRTSLEMAEMVKYIDNVWHALKIAFSNEVGNICKELSVDSHELMEIFCQDRKLNISPAYLKPGFAFGGSCLPKDLRALAYKAKNLDLELPVLESILRSNWMQIERGIQMIIQAGNKKVGILGFSFKAGTDDLRESPMVEVIERLIGKGYDIRLYDRSVNIASLVGANKDFIMNRIPHISRLMMPTLEAVLDHGKTIVIGNNENEFRQGLEKVRPDHVVIDLVRLFDRPSQVGIYEGIAW